jgi:hypothetical protein
MATPRIHRLAVLPALLTLMLLGATSVAAADGSTIAPTTARVVRGTGLLAARGDGVARLRGTYVLTGVLDGGSIRIAGATSRTIIRVHGWASRTRLADGTLIFRGVHGSFTIAGRSIVTTLASHHMSFAAAGHGRAVLRGHGSYWVNDHGPKPWSTLGVDAAF